MPLGSGKLPHWTATFATCCPFPYETEPAWPLPPQHAPTMLSEDCWWWLLLGAVPLGIASVHGTPSHHWDFLDTTQHHRSPENQLSGFHCRPHRDLSALPEEYGMDLAGWRPATLITVGQGKCRTCTHISRWEIQGTPICSVEGRCLGFEE